MQPLRKIIHVDMDAFYASVEQRDRPELKGKPVIVGGDPQSRGVVAACSYEARKFGIHSAMASSTAYKLCPAAVFIRSRFDAYRAVSSQIREIFCEYTDLVEPLSLDEAFLDVTENHKCIPSATLIAQEIKKKIYMRTGGLTASAGVSFNKFIAKVASDINKPKETTLSEDIDDTDQMLEILENIADRLENSLIKREAKGRTITLKIKYFDFQSVTRSITIDEPADTAGVIMKYIKPLLSKTEAGEKKVRLLGISISNFDDQDTNIGICQQLPLPFKGYHNICFLRGINTNAGNISK